MKKTTKVDIELRILHEKRDLYHAEMNENDREKLRSDLVKQALMVFFEFERSHQYDMSLRAKTVNGQKLYILMRRNDVGDRILTTTDTKSGYALDYMDGAIIAAVKLGDRLCRAENKEKTLNKSYVYSGLVFAIKYKIDKERENRSLVEYSDDPFVSQLLNSDGTSIGEGDPLSGSSPTSPDRQVEFDDLLEKLWFHYPYGENAIDSDILSSDYILSMRFSYAAVRIGSGATQIQVERELSIGGGGLSRVQSQFAMVVGKPYQQAFELFPTKQPIVFTSQARESIGFTKGDKLNLKHERRQFADANAIHATIQSRKSCLMEVFKLANKAISSQSDPCENNPYKHEIACQVSGMNLAVNFKYGKGYGMGEDLVHPITIAVFQLNNNEALTA